MSDTITVAGVEMTREDFGLGDPVAEYQERNARIGYAGTEFSRPVFFSLLAGDLEDKPYVCSGCGEYPCNCPDCQQGVFVCTYCYRPTARCNCPGPKREKRGVDNHPAM